MACFHALLNALLAGLLGQVLGKRGFRMRSMRYSLETMAVIV